VPWGDSRQERWLSRTCHRAANRALAAEAGCVRETGLETDMPGVAVAALAYTLIPASQR